ncbi:site-specific integrase [Rhodobacteraceae bacterium HSP-20]|uniref:Site-specific integrase n=1 Tax=Paragemmobacter amnigenus TaxID=2852097 RepID=A0ABS6J1W2_9RHOB|nr:site-specific integrase [Rhodobacter amnigenus]MBU9697749.1 site-specific integrase [Rhodobacter amnigenus]MBV4388976.1 site-specific integrase [Rhodobacter amnigenus]
MGLLSKLLRQTATEPQPPNSSRRSDLLLNEFFDCHFYPYAEATRRRPAIVKYIYDKHLRPNLGQKRLCDLDSKMLDEWVRTHIRKRYKPGTINKHIFLVNRILNVAQNWGMIEHNAYKNCVIKRLPLGDYRQRFLSEGELRTLLDACYRDQHPFLYLFAKLLILTGARSSEARLARWRDFDFQSCIWTVPLSKSGRSRRIVLSSAAIAVLDDIKAQAERLYLPHTVNDYIFINPKFKKPYDSFHLAWDRARQRVGLRDVRIHDLRHTYASLLINKGASIYEVQRLLGHHHVSMTERYAHLMPNTLAERVEIVADILG